MKAPTNERYKIPMGPNKEAWYGQYSLTWGYNNLGDECWLVGSSNQMGTLTSFRSQEQALKWINEHIESDRYDKWTDDVNAEIFKLTDGEFDGEDLPDVLDWYGAFSGGETAQAFAKHLFDESVGGVW
jgi:hypothetical protein